jgi:hypothetical protein
MIALLVNIIGFYLGWFACVMGAANGLVWLGPAVVSLLLLLHLRLQRPRRAELALVGISFLLGFAVDSILVAANVMVLVPDFMPEGVTTFWMMCMWVNFALTLNVALKCLYNRPVISALLGLLGGPAAYYTGAGLGAIVIPDGLWVRLAAIGVAWALVTPLLVWFAKKLRMQFSDDAKAEAARKARMLAGGVDSHSAGEMCWPRWEAASNRACPECGTAGEGDPSSPDAGGSSNGGER